MQKIEINTGQAQSTILLGEKLTNVCQYVPQGKKVIIITDTNVASLYGKHFPNVPCIEIGLGETNKTLQTLELIFDKFIEYEADRSTFILGIGGGIVCDVTGFAASTFMRGLDFGFVSTTLLSQVDASIGGKNGVNFRGYKNMVGVFAQPRFVICDTGMLDTLKERDYTSGMAEIVKAALIKNQAMFDFFVANYSRALTHYEPVLQQLIYDSLIIKRDVVVADEREKGERRKLNFGHTIGHAIEKLTGMMHGEAISIGMVMAARLSLNRGLILQADYDKIVKLLRNLQLPVSIQIDKQALLNAMRKDKKREAESINFVLLAGIGNALVEKVTFNELEEMLNGLCLSC